jgi:hypothetical protein
MTIEEYIEAKKCKPLTEKELQQGKNNLKIYGTSEPMPWSTIYTRLAAGQPMDEIAKMYGHGRKIALWAQQDGVAVQPVLTETVEEEIKHRKRVDALTAANPEVAGTLMEMVNEIAPDLQTKVVQFADKVVQKSIDLLDNQYLESSDIVNVTKAVQTATDTVGVTQRHAAAAKVTNNNIKVQGFDFVLDAPPEEPEAIEGEIDE